MLLIYKCYRNRNCGEPHVGHWELSVFYVDLKMILLKNKLAL